MAWNKSFKAKVTEKYDAWMADGAHSFTAAGNMRGPPRPEIVKWVLEAWETLDRELIIRSFRSCALTVAPDGSEDDQIHCLKEVQPCHSGQDRPASIQQALTTSYATDPSHLLFCYKINFLFTENGENALSAQPRISAHFE